MPLSPSVVLRLTRSVTVVEITAEAETPVYSNNTGRLVARTAPRGPGGGAFARRSREINTQGDGAAPGATPPVGGGTIFMFSPEIFSQPVAFGFRQGSHGAVQSRSRTSAVFKQHRNSSVHQHNDLPVERETFGCRRTKRALRVSPLHRDEEGIRRVSYVQRVRHRPGRWQP